MNEDVADIVARKLRDPRLQQEWLRQDNLIFGGLIAGCVAVMQPFLTAPALDLSALIALVSFASRSRFWRPCSWSTSTRRTATA
jgi:hypothetical protein